MPVLCLRGKRIKDPRFMVTCFLTKTKWKMNAYYVDTCNCDWGCPCQFNAEPTNGNCEGLSAFHVETGNYGQVKLSGLNAAAAYSWPGPIHKGHGRASFYIDDRSSEDQYEALGTILTGQAGGGPFEIYASTLDTFQRPKRARIGFRAKGLKSSVVVPGVGEVQLKPMTNPVTGSTFRAIIELPAGFDSDRIETSSLEKLVVDDGYLKFKYVGTYGSFMQTSWKGP